MYTLALDVIPMNDVLKVDWNWCPFGNVETSLAFGGDGIDDGNNDSNNNDGDGIHADLIIFVLVNGKSCKNDNGG